MPVSQGADCKACLNPSKFAFFKFQTVRLKLLFKGQATDNLHIMVAWSQFDIGEYMENL